MYIREAKECDRSALIRMVQGLNRHEDTVAHNRRLDMSGAIDTLDETMARIAETGGRMIVAENADGLVGYLALCFESRGAWVREDLRSYGYIRELFVDDAARGKGVGKALMAEAEKITHERGVKVMMVGVLTGNDLAEKAYARAGYKPFAIELLKPLDDNAKAGGVHEKDE